MEITVKANRVKSSPKKMILVTSLIKKMSVSKAKVQLKYTNKEAATQIYDLLKSAVAACKDKDMNLDDCYIKSCSCDQGVALKRRRMVERGKATAIRKRTSNIILVISDEVSSKNKTINKVDKNNNKDIKKDQ